MKQYFVTSLFWNGLLGGGLTVDPEGITYHTGKLTVPPEIRKLKLPYGEISEYFPQRHLLLPTVLIRMKDGSEYRFLVFARKRFLQAVDALKTN